MELRSYIAVVRRRARVIAIITAVSVLVGGIGTLLMPPAYVASTTLRVRTAGNLSAGSVSYDSIMYATRLLNTYSKIATGAALLDEVRKQLGISDLPKVTVDVPPNSELMQLSVENRDASVAASEANTLADLLIERVKQLDVTAATNTREALGAQLAQLQADSGPGDLVPQQQQARLADEYVNARLAETTPQDSMYVLEPATVPQAPARPQRSLNLAIALLLGLAGGVGVAFVLDNVDPKLYTTRGIETVVDLAALTAVPAARNSSAQHFFAQNSPELEALRRVSAHLCGPQVEPAHALKVMVTSAVPKEGKSTVVANLAVLLAGTGRSVAVVDCDLRLPAQHKIFALPNDVGLSSYLSGARGLESIVHATHLPQIDVVPSGPTPVDPAALLDSRYASTFFEELDNWYDVVLVDCPSLLGIADGLALVPLMDRVVLVVGRGVATAEGARMAREQLVGAGAKSIGLVVTRAEPESDAYTYYRRAAIK